MRLDASFHSTWRPGPPGRALLLCLAVADFDCLPDTGSRVETHTIPDAGREPFLEEPIQPIPLSIELEAGKVSRGQKLFHWSGKD